MRRRVLMFSALGCLVVLVAGELFYRAMYGNYSPWSLPERLDYCGQRYYRAQESSYAGGVYVTEAQGLTDSARTSFVYGNTVGLLHRWRVYRTDDFQCPESDQAQRDQYVFIKVGPDRYLEMTDAD